VELKNGETYNGHMVQCDTWMNIHLREVICTSKVGGYCHGRAGLLLPPPPPDAPARLSAATNPIKLACCWLAVLMHFCPQPHHPGMLASFLAREAAAPALLRATPPTRPAASSRPSCPCPASAPQDGDRFWRMPEAYLRGNTIKYLRVPDEVLDKAKEADFRREGGPAWLAGGLLAGLFAWSSVL
jgi:small nuclear ribonucleoprotein (snRNP)-like protein